MPDVFLVCRAKQFGDSFLCVRSHFTFTLTVVSSFKGNKKAYNEDKQ